MNKNRLKILHLSDLHFSNKTEMQVEKFDTLVKTIDNHKPFDYIFITGDIIDCGKTEFYEIALRYLNQLFDSLKINKDNIFIVPGNHDNDLNTSKQEECELRNSLKNATYDKIQEIEDKNKKILYKIQKRQDKFINFLNKLEVKSKFPNFYIQEDKCVICINSSIFSDKHDYRNQIYFISSQFDETIKKISDIDNKKIFILTHHPIDYYEENTKDDILNFARQHNAFIFSGHSHIQAYEKQFRNNQVAHQFWCGNFQDDKNASFNIVEIDYELEAFRLSVGKYCDNNWFVEQRFSDKIKDSNSDILSFLMDLKQIPDKIGQFRKLWNKLFDSQILQFDDFWTESSLLVRKISDKKLRSNIKHCYSGTECCLLYLLFHNIDNCYATKLFKDIPINLNKLNWYKENRYKRELLNTAAILLPDLFKFP